MHPMFEYETLRRGREELLRQAELERMARLAMVKDRIRRGFRQRFAHWLGSQMVRWGRQLEHFGKCGQPASLWPASPHH
jgi:hypothetical protein